MSRPILCVDFDGVIHSYTSHFRDIDHVADPPVPGAIEFLYEANKHFEVHIFSSRSREQRGIDAMKDYIKMQADYIAAFEDTIGDKKLEWLNDLKWPTEKPPAMITLDDRAITFTGEWPDMETLKNFKPWNKQ